jgi:hypothetical protein
VQPDDFYDVPALTEVAMVTIIVPTTTSTFGV